MTNIRLIVHQSNDNLFELKEMMRNLMQRMDSILNIVTTLDSKID